MDDETLAMMKAKGIYYIPTIDHNRYYYDNAAYLHYDKPSQKEGLQNFIQRNLETTRKAFRAGAMIVMGSDAIYTMFGENTRELAWFVQAGMTPAQALATATTNAAELLRLPQKLGRIAPAADPAYA